MAECLGFCRFPLREDAMHTVISAALVFSLFGNSLLFSAICKTTTFIPEPGVNHQALKIVEPAGERKCFLI